VWDLGNGFTSTNLDTVFNSYSNPGLYDVSLDVVSPDGCENDTTYFNYIEIFDYPTAGFTSYPNPVSILTPTVQFTDSSSNNIIDYEWFFFDNTNSLIHFDNSQNPIYVFSDEEEQNYSIELKVTDSNGCRDSVIGIQYVEADYSFFMPNSFTPNGDGLNDYFSPTANKIDISMFKFTVFNRWGETVFITSDVNDSWDGKYKGKDVIEDTYLWIINVKDAQSGHIRELRGYIQLSR
jgi:gliding motility-associated-like protein